MSETTEALDTIVSLFKLLPKKKKFLLRPVKEDVTEIPFEKLLKESKLDILGKGVTQKHVNALLTELGVLKTHTLPNGVQGYELRSDDLMNLVNAHPSGLDLPCDDDEEEEEEDSDYGDDSDSSVDEEDGEDGEDGDY